MRNVFKILKKKRSSITQELERLHTTWARPKTKTGQAIENLTAQPLTREYRLIELLRRPTVSYYDLMNAMDIDTHMIDTKVAEQIEIQIKYAGYIDRQQDEIAKHLRHEETKIPAYLDYNQISSLSAEVRQILNTSRPLTIGMASRLPGMTPAAISLLLVHLKKLKVT